MIRLPLVVAAGLLTADLARADLPPPLPFTMYSTPTHRIETREDVRDYVFLVARRGLLEPSAQPFEFVIPEGRGPTTLTIRGEYREQAELSVVPKSVAERYTTAQELAAAIESGRVLRVTRHVFVFREMAPSWSPAPVVTYELRRSGPDGLVIVRTTRDPLWQWYSVAIPFTLAILFSGFWLVRRFVRIRRAARDAKSQFETDRRTKRLLAVLLFILFALGAVSLARADVGPPPGTKAVPVTTIVEATEDFPDYAFIETSFSSRPGPPPHGGSSRSISFHFFLPGTTIKASGDWRSGGRLFAVPRSVMEKYSSWKDYVDAAKHNPGTHARISASDDWFDLTRSVSKGEVPGATSIRFGGHEALPVADARTAITETYRIVRTPAGVAFVKPEDVGRTEGDPTLEQTATSPWMWVVAGGAAFGSILLGGLWLVLRSRRV